jgi:mannose-1-phosphate guanylyltransferase
VIVVILAGGVGERFWPLSRRRRPKQLLDLTGRGSMLRLTLDRVEPLARLDERFVFTSVSQRESVLAEVAGRVPDANVVAEPEVRNTAPAIGLAAALAKARLGNAPMLVVPADHWIEPAQRFCDLVRAGARYLEGAGRDSLVTIGIPPTRAETGFGYIRVADPVWQEGEARVFRAAGFVEKPSAERAVELVAAGCLWNSGVFLWTTDALLSAVARHLPELDAVLGRMIPALGTPSFAEVLKREYPQAPSVSIDFGVMEKASNVVVMRANFEWSDVGSWEFVRGTRTADPQGNVLVGDHVVVDGSNNTIVASGRVVGLVGVDDVVVVDGGDALLVCRRDRVQDVRRVVAELKRRGRDELT